MSSSSGLLLKVHERNLMRSKSFKKKNKVKFKKCKEKVYIHVKIKKIFVYGHSCMSKLDMWAGVLVHIQMHTVCVQICAPAPASMLYFDMQLHATLCLYPRL